MRRAIVALTLTLAMLASGVSAAQATTVAEPAVPTTPTAGLPTSHELQVAVDSYKAQGYPYTVVDLNGQRGISIPLGDQGDLVLPDQTAALPSGPVRPTPNVSGGFEWFLQPYIDFTPTEQKAIAGGAGAALTILICALGPVGIAICAAAAGLIVGAATFIGINGICSGRLRVGSKYGLGTCV